MECDKAANRVLRDMKMMGIISEDKIGEARPYLQALWVAGWEHNRLIGYHINNHGNNRPIGQFDRNGKLLNVFKSKTHAARLTGYCEKSIYNSICNEKPSRKGWLWKWL